MNSVRWIGPARRAALLLMACLAAPGARGQAAWTPLDQGAAWTAAARSDFYSRDQGSRIMPLRWMVALRQANGAPFLDASLARYGYLPNEAGTPGTGAPPDYLIVANIRRADAPVRYPFLWNAARQDKTQWPGFADNGNAILGLARNLGEVTGVFATYHPRKDDGRLLGINYVGDNSANLEGLTALERLIRKVGAPRWPWPVDDALAERGRAVFAQNCATGCHEVRNGALRSLLPDEATWATPVLNVGTDTREWTILGRSVDPGVLGGAAIPGFHEPLRNPEAPINVLGLSVVGSILQHALPLVVPDDLGAQIARAGSAFGPDTAPLRGAFRNAADTVAADAAAAPVPGAYESRVLEGIWATAPYLHNGSVASLADLLKPATQRAASFAIGPNYDRDGVGLAAEQAAFAPSRLTTGCDDTDSGNSRRGHEFGTTLAADQKRALLEYLKTL